MIALTCPYCRGEAHAMKKRYNHSANHVVTYFACQQQQCSRRFRVPTSDVEAYQRELTEMAAVYAPTGTDGKVTVND